MASDKKRIFLASSAELVEDRREFEIFINRQNDRWHERGVFLKLELWENFVDAMSKTRLQDEYNKALKGCDVFVMLFWTKVGMYTAEEFETAFGQFRATGRPLIYTYCRKITVPMDEIDEDDAASLLAFKKKLKALGHFQTGYADRDGLCRHFGAQLEKLALDGFFGTIPGPETAVSLAAGTPSNTATLHGSGATAQGAGAQAVGAGGVLIGGNSSGPINTGTIHTGGGMFLGPVNAGRDVVGGNQTIHHAPADAPASSGPALNTLLVGLAAQVQAKATTAQATTVAETVNALAAETAKGDKADDSKLAHLVKGLIDLVPAAVGGIVSAFASPVLGGLAGPLTKAVLEKIQGGGSAAP